MKQNADRSVLDMDRLIEVYEEDLDGMLELFDLMLKNNTALLAKLEHAAQEHDLEGVRSASHAMKGSVGNVGGIELYKLAQEIEDKARDGSWDGLVELVKKARPALDRLRREVDSLRIE
ncbi:MAG: Hpt domain-containing protein [Candidatus Eremiobacteraeota bacterium]|nr:Hpt domain-containing protein [Candidatus Eremiobacteraeota bacterium]